MAPVSAESSLSTLCKLSRHIWMPKQPRPYRKKACTPPEILSEPVLALVSVAKKAPMLAPLSAHRLGHLSSTSSSSSAPQSSRRRRPQCSLSTLRNRSTYTWTSNQASAIRNAWRTAPELVSEPVSARCSLSTLCSWSTYTCLSNHACAVRNVGRTATELLS